MSIGFRANFDEDNGALSGTPSSLDIGTNTDIVISVSDGVLTASLPAFSITVTEFNSLPQISGEPAPSVFQRDEYVFTPEATDADDNNLTFTISNPPDWTTFNNRTGTLRGIPVAVNVELTVILLSASVMEKPPPCWKPLVLKS